MAIEAGARAGIIAVDQTTIDYIKGRPFAPKDDLWDQAVNHWQQLHSDPDAKFDRIIRIDARDLQPQVTWGTSPEMVVPIDGQVPDPAAEENKIKQDGIQAALKYMGLTAGTLIDGYLSG